MASGKKKRVAYRRRKQDRDVTILILVAIIILGATFGIKSISLIKRLNVYEEKAAHYQQLIEEENQRKEELAEFEKYTKTTKYIQEVAQQKFGLVKDGEILFVSGK